MFVHGALCVAYSGQCFSSEAWGGRSANRGQCAQACRLPYDLMVDGAEEPLGDARYLLSPGDLYTLREIPAIVASGVAALKIEGRYKDAEYVAITTQRLSQGRGCAWAGCEHTVAPAEETKPSNRPIRAGSARTLLPARTIRAVVRGRAPRHRGVEMGRVMRVGRNAVITEPSERHDMAPLKAGDGIVFDAADWRSPQEAEEGGRLYEMAVRPGNKLELRFANGAVNFARIRPGDLVWRSHDPDLDRLAKPYLEAASPVHKQPVRVTVNATEGAPLEMKWEIVRSRIVVKQTSEEALGSAQKRQITQSYIHDQLGRLGNTAYELKGVSLNVGGNPFVPPSLLNQMRRDAVEMLEAKQAASIHHDVSDPGLCGGVGDSERSAAGPRRCRTPSVGYEPPNNWKRL